MDSYRIAVTRSAEAELRGVPFPFRRQISAAIFKLKGRPCPEGREEVPDAPGAYRLRVSGWRILYAANPDEMLIVIYAVVK